METATGLLLSATMQNLDLCGCWTEADFCNSIITIVQSSTVLRLLAEAVALWGALQLLSDQHLPAAARERAVVAHVRAVLASTGDSSDAAHHVERCLPGVLALIRGSQGQGAKGAASAGERIC